MEHNDIPSGEIHTPYQWVVADATARAAITPTAGDVHKLCLQQSDNSEWRLTDDSPVTWATMDGGLAAHVGAGGTAHANAVASGAAGFITGADQAKLNGIESGANNYTHPVNHAPSIISQDTNNRFVTDAEKTEWNSKAASDHNHSGVYDPAGSAASAQSAAISAAATDATTKANAAQSAAQSYADGLVVGLVDDRGNFDASGNAFPSSGGSGAAGAILKGDLWTVSVAGTLGGNAVTAGDLVRALIDSPGTTSANWAITENNIGYVAENAANKNASGGYAGLTLFKLDLRNSANTITSWFTTAATVARTWTMPDKDGTVAMTSDITGTNSGTNTGDQTIQLTGDVTGSGTGSFAATIANNAVTLAKMATMATASFLGRNTAGTGDPEVLSASTVKTILALNNVDNTSNATERAASATLENKTVNLGSNTLSGTTAEFNAALSDGDFVTYDANNMVPRIQIAATTKSAAATLTAAEMRVGLLVASGTTYTITVPTAADLDTVMAASVNNRSFDWSLINTASGAITVGANGNASFGSLAIAAGESALFRFRRTSATPAYTIYRIA